MDLFIKYNSKYNKSFYVRLHMKVLCFGSLNLDHVYRVDHIVRPGETITSSSYQIFSGGKGLNQAVALGRANAACTMAGAIGKDGLDLLAALEQSNISTDRILVKDDRTGHTIIQVDRSGQNSILYFPGTNQMVDESYIEQVLSAFEPDDYILLQNEINNVPAIMKRAKQKGLRIAFNPSPITSDLLGYPLELVDLFILNELEGYELTQEKKHGKHDPSSPQVLSQCLCAPDTGQRRCCLP